MDKIILSSRSSVSIRVPHLAMLPRHLRSLVLSRRSSGASGLLTLSQRNRGFPAPFRIPPHAGSRGRQIAGFHSSSSRQSDGPKSPFQTFVEVLRDELKKNRELQDNVKQLQGDVDKLQDSEAMKKARAAYERARVCEHFHHMLEPLSYFFIADI